MATMFYRPALSQLADKMQRNFDEGTAAGASILIHQGNAECYYHATGFAHLSPKAPVARDTIFRMYSMTKPITMTAVMQLFERGLLFMEDRLEDLIPEFRDVPVAVEQPDGPVTIEKQKSPFTIRQLCTMTSVIGYGDPDGNAGERAIAAAMDKHPEDMSTLDAVRMVAKEGALSFHPGEKWMYGFSHDVLGAVVEVVAGMRYGDYLRQNIFDPLSMPDTGFVVPSAKAARFADACIYQKGAYKRMKDAEYNEAYMDERLFESGGGGLVSTIDDYAHFCQMLVNFGRRGNERILGRKSVEMMRANQLNEAQLATYHWYERGYGYGVGMRTHQQPWLLNSSPREFGWDGMMGTWMVVDPAEQLTVVYLQNMMPYNNNGMRLMPIIYGAMD